MEFLNIFQFSSPLKFSSFYSFSLFYDHLMPFNLSLPLLSPSRKREERKKIKKKEENFPFCVHHLNFYFSFSSHHLIPPPPLLYKTRPLFTLLWTFTAVLFVWVCLGSAKSSLFLFILFSFKMKSDEEIFLFFLHSNDGGVQIISHHLIKIFSSSFRQGCARGEFSSILWKQRKIRVKKFVNNFNGYFSMLCEWERKRDAKFLSL